MEAMSGPAAADDPWQHKNPNGHLCFRRHRIYLKLYEESRRHRVDLRSWEVSWGITDRPRYH